MSVLSLTDEQVELVALIVEGEANSIMTFRGLGSRRKADREAAAHRKAGWEEACVAIADMIRAHGSGQSLSPQARLSRCAENDNFLVGFALCEALQFAHDGYLTITAELEIKGEYNSIPAHVIYHAKLTERGEKYLASGVLA